MKRGRRCDFGIGRLGGDFRTGASITALPVVSLVCLGSRALTALLISFLPIGVADLPRGLVAAGCCGFFQFVGFFLVFQLEKVSYIQEGVALESDVDKCRLHTWKHAGDAPVIDRARQSVLVFAFVIDFRELIVF